MIALYVTHIILMEFTTLIALSVYLFALKKTPVKNAKLN